MIETQRLPKQKLPHDFSHFKRLQMATSCNNSPVTGNVMIETKLYFVNEVSDFPPCNQSMLIVSNHTCSSFSFLLFHFEQSRSLSFLRAVILFSLFFCFVFALGFYLAPPSAMRWVSYFTLPPTFCFHFCVQFTSPAGLWRTAIFSLWRSGVNICVFTRMRVKLCLIFFW